VTGKVRYKGPAKNEAQLFALYGLANIVIAKRRWMALHRRGTRIAHDPLPQQREEIAMAMHTALSRRGLIGTIREYGGGSHVYA